MSFRQQMKGFRPGAEEWVHTVLQSRGLHKTMEPVGSVILLDSGRVVGRESLLTGFLKQLRDLAGLRHVITIPDFLWLPDLNPKLGGKAGLPVFLHGPVHKTDGNRRRDELICARLVDLGFAPLPCPYSSPSSRWVHAVVDRVEAKIR